MPWSLTWHDLSHICVGPWAKEVFALSDPNNSVGVPVLVRIFPQALVLADPHLTGSMKSGRSYLPPYSTTSLSPPPLYPRKHVPWRCSLAKYQCQSNQDREKLGSFCPLLVLPPQPQQMRSGVSLADVDKRFRNLGVITMWPVLYQALLYVCIYALDFVEHVSALMSLLTLSSAG